MKGLFQEDLCMSALADTRVLFISMCEVRYANVCYNAVFHQSQHAGSRWYNTEVCESWKPKQSKKGIYIKH